MFVFSATCFTLLVLGAVDGRIIPDGPSIIIMKVMESKPITKEFKGPSMCNVNNDEDDQKTKIFRIPIMSSDDDDLSLKMKMENLRFKDLMQPFNDISEKPQERSFRSRLLDHLSFRPMPMQPAIPDEDEQETKIFRIPTKNSDDYDLGSEMKMESFAKALQRSNDAHLAGIRSRLLYGLPLKPIPIHPAFHEENEQPTRIFRIPTLNNYDDEDTKDIPNVFQRVGVPSFDYPIRRPEEGSISSFMDRSPFRPMPIPIPPPPFYEFDSPPKPLTKQFATFRKLLEKVLKNFENRRKDLPK